MYKRVSIALKNPGVSITLRLATLILLGSLAWFKFEGLDLTTSWLQFDLLLPLLVVSILSMANLLTESSKYRLLLGQKRIDLPTAFRSVIAGMSVGIWTPNRVGEFMGRMRYAPEGDKKRSAGATVIGSLLQGSVTILFGFLGLGYFEFGFNIPLDLNLVVAASLVLGIAMVIVFRRGPIAAFRRKHFEIHRSEIMAAAVWAVVRYAIFSTQFVILLFAFGFNGTLFEAYSGVFLLYAIQSYLPGSFFSELGVREVLSVLFFSSFFDNAIAAPLAAFCLWMLNIGFPILSWSLYSGVKKLEA